ncbi:hypothetical protein GGI21_000841 [Coemansia aciculifera]|nr:hypothetical protein GGI21_000841 [Coemansia aciculifera]
MLAALSSSFSLVSEETMCSETEELVICAQLDRVNARRLDSQCAVRRRLPPRQQQHLQRRRLANQDLSQQRLPPPSSQDYDGGQRLAVLSAQRGRELFLAGIADRLGRLDTDRGSLANDQQAVLHPRVRMRRFVFASVDRINRLTDDMPMAAQRFSPSTTTTNTST